jgi:hypothetical protein
MLAETAVSDKVIPPIGGVSGEREKEGWGRRPWAIYNRDGVGSGLGFGARGDRTAQVVSGSSRSLAGGRG